MARPLYFLFVITKHVGVSIIAKSQEDAIEIFKMYFGDELFSKVTQII